MKTILLAGGLGTRVREETEFKPKPMITIGTQPILWHIMKIYSHYGINEFVTCVGYKGEHIRQYFRDFETMNLDFTVEIGAKSAYISHGEIPEAGWKVTVTETGAETMTGGRIQKANRYVENQTFMCTYGDGVADVDISKLLAFHKQQGKIATLTAVQPTSRFGVLDISTENTVKQFREKPISDDWINAGFFVFEPEIFNYLQKDCMLENEPFSQLAADNELAVYRHNGFWQPMDTYREVKLLNEMWDQNVAPWKVWQ